MRQYVKRGAVSSKAKYLELREKVWDEVRALDQEQHVIHNRDIQEIAMCKAMELGLHEFKVKPDFILSNKALVD